MATLQSFPFAVGLTTAPPPEYDAIRAEAGLRRVSIVGGRRALLVTRYADVRFVLADQRFSRLSYSKLSIGSVPQENLPLVTIDPPYHTRRRASVAPAFTRHRVRSMRVLVEEVVAEVLDELVAGPTPVDLVRNFSRPITMVVMCRVLGLPERDQDRLEAWGERTMAAGRYPVGTMMQAHKEMHAYFGELVENRRRAVDNGGAADDVLGQMLVNTRAERQLSSAEVVSQISGVFYAGYESTSSQMSSAVFELLKRPEYAERMRTDEDSVAPIVEELLRFLTIAENGGMHHVATEDIELPSGSRVAAGEIVIPIPDAANHDPEVFEDPGLFCPARKNNNHMAFGHGLHYCVGSELARLELQVALSALLRRLPTLTLAVPESDLRWRSDMLVRGLWEFPVRW